MTDMERINMMADANWKPASTYWKEQFDKVSAELQAEREHVLEAANELTIHGVDISAQLWIAEIISSP